MVLPSPFRSTLNYGNLHYYQGILVVQLVLTLLVFLILQIIHYVKWGYDQEAAAEGKEGQGAPKQPQEDATSRKWQQKAWNVYFPVIFGNHVAAVGLIILYIPYIYSAVIGFLHFAAFLALVIVNIFIKDAEPGNGSRTKVSRLLWGIMCVLNVMLIIGGLTGVSSVLQ